VVHFTGPASWESNMVASVVYPTAVNVGSIDSPSQPVQVQNGSGTINFSANTQPPIALDYPNVSIHIEANPGVTSSTVPLIDRPPANPPPSGYRVTGITISPATVIITGDQVALGRIQSILLPAIDLSGHVSDTTVQITIPYPSGVTGNVSTATVKYSISPNPNVSPGG
jgi:hypothetical protein